MLVVGLLSMKRALSGVIVLSYFTLFLRDAWGLSSAPSVLKASSSNHQHNFPMYKIFFVCLLALLLISPVIALAEEKDEPVGHQIGQVGREIRDGAKEGFRETKKAGKEVAHEVKVNSKPVWAKTKQGFKDFWQNVKDGFGGKKDASPSE